MAMRLNPLAVSSMIEDRRHEGVKHSYTRPADEGGIDAFSWQQCRHIGSVPVLAHTVPRTGKSWADPLPDVPQGGIL
jgi:hypothetical protein